jgi:hypothetical protein
VRDSKYSKFGQYLENRKDDEFSLSFNEIEKIVGSPLPPSADNRWWWSNNVNNNVMTWVWQQAGFLTEAVDMKGRRVVFRRKPSVLPRPSLSPEEQAASDRRRFDMMARLKKYSQSKPTSAAGMAGGALPYSGPANAAPTTTPRCRHPLYGALKGYIRLVAGTDLTEPADPEWGERIWGDDTK